MAGWVAGGFGSGRVNCRDVYQHDRDIVLNGVNAAADTAFQALPIRVQDDRLFTDRADQHVQQILGDHRDIIVMLREVILHGVIPRRGGNSRATSLPQETQENVMR